MVVVWRTTTRCNLACPFCGFDRRLGIPRADVAPSGMRAFLRALAEYQFTQRDPVLVSWLGGEPFLWPHLHEMTAYAVSQGLRVSLTTNGTALADADSRRFVADHLAELTVSMDSPGDLHDELRGRAGLRRELARAIPALAEAANARPPGPKLRINAVLLRQTIDDFPTLAREAAGWGVHEITFNLLGGRDRPEYFDAHVPTLAQWDAFVGKLPALRAELKPAGLTIAGGHAYLWRLRSSLNRIACPVEDCAPGKGFLFVDETGTVAPCSFTGAALGLPIGDLRTAADVTTLADQFAVRRTQNRPRTCADCPSTNAFSKFAPPSACTTKAPG